MPNGLLQDAEVCNYPFHALARCTAVLKVRLWFLIPTYAPPCALTYAPTYAPPYTNRAPADADCSRCYLTRPPPRTSVFTGALCVQEIDAASHEVKKRLVLLDPRTSTGAVIHSAFDVPVYLFVI